jgi:phosphoglycolate phosphatase
MAVLSNKPHEDTLRCIERFFNIDGFQAVFGMRDDTPRKPHQAGALKISEMLGIPPSAFIFLGDTSIDMQTAVNARMVPVGATWGFRTEKELLESGARKLISHPEALLDII